MADKNKSKDPTENMAQGYANAIRTGNQDVIDAYLKKIDTTIQNPESKDLIDTIYSMVKPDTRKTMNVDDAIRERQEMEGAPTDSKIGFARMNLFGYGTPWEKYFSYDDPAVRVNEQPNLPMGASINRALDYDFEDFDKMPKRKFSEYTNLGDIVRKGLLESNKSAVASLGADPEKTQYAKDWDRYYPLFGSTEKSGDRNMIVGGLPQTFAHEAMHRGLSQLGPENKANDLIAASGLGTIWTGAKPEFSPDHQMIYAIQKRLGMVPDSTNYRPKDQDKSPDNIMINEVTRRRELDRMNDAVDATERAAAERIKKKLYDYQGLPYNDEWKGKLRKI